MRAPTAASRMRASIDLTTTKLTSASSRARRISRSTSSTSDSRSVPLLRSRAKMPSKRSESDSNMSHTAYRAAGGVLRLGACVTRSTTAYDRRHARRSPPRRRSSRRSTRASSSGEHVSPQMPQRLVPKAAKARAAPASRPRSTEVAYPIWRRDRSVQPAAARYTTTHREPERDRAEGRRGRLRHLPARRGGRGVETDAGRQGDGRESAPHVEHRASVRSRPLPHHGGRPSCVPGAGSRGDAGAVTRRCGRRPRRWPWARSDDDRGHDARRPGHGITGMAC